jgi:hypothetical protein
MVFRHLRKRAIFYADLELGSDAIYRSIDRWWAGVPELTTQQRIKSRFQRIRALVPGWYCQWIPSEIALLTRQRRRVDRDTPNCLPISPLGTSGHLIAGRGMGL